MKWWVKILLLLIALLIVWGGWTLFSNTAETPDGELISPSRLASVNDVVAVRATSSADFAPVSGEVEVFPGAIVRTDETGRGIVETPDGSITVIDTETELTIAATERGRTTLALHAGNLWSRIEKSLEQGEFYEIETEHLVAAVRGTSFGTLSGDTTTTILIATGTVTTVPKDPATGARIPENATSTPGGYKVIVDDNGTLRVEPLFEEDRNSFWFRLNNPESTNVFAPVDTAATAPAPAPAPLPIAAPPPPAPTLELVNPPEVTLGEENNVVLTGSGFTNVTDIFVDTQDIPEFFVTQDTTLYFDARQLDDTGTFDVSVVSGAGTTTLQDALTVREPAPEEEPPPPQDTSDNRYY